MNANVVLLIIAICGGLALVLIVNMVLDHLRNKRVQDQHAHYNEAQQVEWQRRAQGLVTDTKTILGKAKKGGVVAKKLALEFAEDETMKSGVPVGDYFRVDFFDLRVDVEEAKQATQTTAGALTEHLVVQAALALRGQLSTTSVIPATSVAPVVPALSAPARPALAAAPVGLDLDQQLETQILSMLKEATTRPLLTEALVTAKAYCEGRPQLAAKLADILLKYELKLLVANAKKQGPGPHLQAIEFALQQVGGRPGFEAIQQGLEELRVGVQQQKQQTGQSQSGSFPHSSNGVASSRQVARARAVS